MYREHLAAAFFACLVVLAAVPLVALAQAGNIDAVANLQCAQEVARRQAQQPPIPPPPSPPFPCAGPHTSGQCIGVICKSEKYISGAGNAAGSTGLDLVKQILGSLMQKLMQGGGGGSQGGSPPPGGGGTGCQMQGTNDKVLADANPSCYYYIQPTSAGLSNTGTDTSGIGTSDISNQLNNLFNDTSNTNSDTNTNTNVSQILSTNTDTNTAQTTNTTQNNDNSSKVIVSTTQGNPTLTQQANLTPGLSGDVQVQGTGGTIVAGTVDPGKNTAVSGFFGSQSYSGGEGSGIVSGLCQNRPWAGFFLSYVIPSSFFDSLCALRGFQVGTPAPAQQPTVTVTQSAPQPTAKTDAPKQETPTVEPKADIWASPSTVSLGSRTSIFWTSQGVTSCSITSPDGNFSQTTFSGGASTAPITGATVFTISCVAPDGSHVTDNVTVNLAI